MIDKGLATKSKEDRGNKYLLSEVGREAVSRLYLDRDHLKNTVLDEEELKRQRSGLLKWTGGCKNTFLTTENE